jgi:protein involved in polysaccharide export with SLBB domain
MPDLQIRFLTVTAALLATVVTGGGQAMIRKAEPVTPAAQAPAAAAPAGPLERTLLVDPNKKLAVGDQVSIEIVQDKEPPVSKIVTATGDLDIPPLDRVRVAGKTTAEAAADIKRRLEADYYYQATVKLSIDRVNTAATMGKIHLQGEVRAPGVIDTYAGENLTLNEAILRVGGFKEFADPRKVKVTRRVGGA